MFPEVEITHLILAVAAAEECASKGELAAGYSRLLDGLHTAQQALAAGEPWGRALAKRYRIALAVYIKAYGVKLE